MNRLLLLILGACVFLGACVQSPVFKGDGYAFFRTNYPVVSVNGVEIAPSYRLDIPAGENTLVIVYHTYRFDYHCTFTWTAVTETAYEVTDQDNKYPLTLYRWVRTNSLWASRLDPIDPLHCTPEPRR
jgi:hypothetical protein